MADEVVSGVVEGAAEAVNFANVKTVGEMTAFHAGQLMANSVAHQNRLNILAEACLGTVVNKMHALDPSEAISLAKAVRADLAEQQVGVKAAQTTPPVTP